MRSFLLGCVALSVALPASEAVADPARKAVRKVELIVMQPAPSPTTAAAGLAVPDEAQPSAKVAIPAPLPPSFQAHDLSRRWVQFEMANSFASASADAVGKQANDADPFANVGVANLAGSPLPPPIAVPAWMRAGLAFSTAPTSFAPACAPSFYRPTGFLEAPAEYRRAGFYDMMSSIACEYGIPVGLFDAMIIRESRYNVGIFSSKKAFGLTQLMPDTAAALGVDRYDVEQNLRGGARYLRQQLDHFGQVHLALAAYNAGPGRVKNGFIPRIAETQAYVENVLLNWRRLAGLADGIAVQTVSGRPGRQASLGRVATVSSY
jgi:soluble lytic murein transglycosylase-like protein